MYNFESVMRVRNELSSIVRSDVAIAFDVYGMAPKPSDFMYILGLRVDINGRRCHCEPMDLNEYGPHLKNSLVRPTAAIPKWIEDSSINVKFGGGSAILASMGYISYIKKPSLVSSGSEIDSTGAVDNAREYMVLSGTITYDGLSYSVDQTFVGSATTAFTGSGTIAMMNNTDLGFHLHEEVCRRASVILMGNVENSTKVISKTVENEQA